MEESRWVFSVGACKLGYLEKVRLELLATARWVMSRKEGSGASWSRT